MKTILACVDFSDVSAAVVNQASALGNALGAELYLLHVVPIQLPLALEPPVPVPLQDLEAQTRDARACLEQLAHDLNPRFLLVRSGSSVEVILKEAEALAADIIVAGSHGHGALYQLVVGGTLQGVLRQAPCPTLVIPSRKPGK